MNRDEAIEIIEEVAGIVDGEVRTEYSGRGMFGKTCYGISCRNGTTCIEEAAARGLRKAKTDDMGLGVIVYWPNIKGE
jgi:hypothetical protein